MFLHLQWTAGFEGPCFISPLSPTSLPWGPPTVSPLRSSCVSCQERGFLKAPALSCSCRGQYFYPASASCLLAGGFCFLELGLAISDKEQAFLSHQNPEVGLLMESAAGSPGPWPTHTSSLLPQPPVAPRQPSHSYAGVETRAAGGQRGNRGISAAGNGKIHSYQTGTAKKAQQPGGVLQPGGGEQPAGLCLDSTVLSPPWLRDNRARIQS